MGSRVIDAVLRMKDEGFAATLKQSSALLTSFGREGNAARKQVENVGKSIASLGKSMTAAITLPITGMGAVSYRAYEGVNKNIQLVKATMGEAKFATADLANELADAMTKSIFTMDEGSAALVNFARQGWDAKQSADMLSPALNLSAGTATALENVTSGLGNTLKAFGASSEEAAHYADMFTVAQAQANTSAQQLMDSMAIAGPIAKTVGWDFEDIATLIGAFGDMSIEASEGANALKTGLARLSGGNKKADEAMEELGISLYNDQEQMKSMVDVIETLQGAFNGMTEQEQMYYASQLFGQNQMSKWLALINGPAADALGNMRDNITNASGNAQEAANAMMTPLEKLSSTFDVFKYKVGETLADAVVPFIEKATELIDLFRQMPKEQQQNIVKWAAIAAAVGPVLMIFGNAVTMGSKLCGAFSTISKAGGVLKLALGGLAAPAGIVIAVIAAIGVVIASVVTHFETFKSALASTGGFEKLKEAFGGLKEQFDASMPTLTKLADLIGNAIAAAAGIAAGAIATYVSGMIEAFSGVLKMFTSVVEGIDKLIHGDLTGALESFKGVFEGAVQYVQGLFDMLFGTIKSIGDAISSIKLPEWSDPNGHKYEVTEARATGDVSWRGGPVQVHEQGGEILDLPHGTRIYPHDVSIEMARQIGKSSVAKNPRSVAGAGNINIAKIADSIIIREEADIEKIGDMLVRKLMTASENMGGVYGNMA